MTIPKEKNKIKAEIAQLYRSDPATAPEAIESYLQSSCEGLSLEEKVALIDQIVQELQAVARPAPPAPLEPLDTQSLAKLVPLLLGKDISEIDCTTEELIERLADSLNTVFDMLNELILGINSTFMGQVSGTETIRLVIRSNVDDSAESISLHNYLAQIKEAFSIMHDAFKEAATVKIKEVLTELDPDEIEKSLNGGLKIGPFQKAEMFKVYAEKHRTLENWLKTGLISEALLREFEKNCQKIYANK